MSFTDLLGYLDPGVGSLFIQALIAAAVTVPFLLRTKITATIRRLRNRD